MKLLKFFEKFSYLIFILVPIIWLSVFFLTKTESFLPPHSHNQKWVRVFNDDFNKPELDSSLWTTCYDWYDKKYSGCSNNGNNEDEWYKEKNVSVHKGNVILTAVKDPTKGWNKSYEKVYQYTSGLISTGRENWNSQPKKIFKYGYFEARMKIPKGQSIWPAFWLLPSEKDVWPPEIDIMEYIGQNPRSVLLTYHWKGLNGEHLKDNTTFNSPVDLSSDYHIFSLNWQPDKIDWYIDGVKQKAVIGSNVPAIPMEMVINLAVGGNLPGSVTSATPKSTSMKIDYVRVYELQPK